jgi:hypothetical protein
MAASLDSLWRERTGQPLTFVIGSTWIAGNLAFYGPDRPRVLIDGDFKLAPWVTPEALAKAGALLVWSASPRTGAEDPPVIPAGFPAIAEHGVVTIPERSWLGHEDVSIAWGIMPAEK